MKSVIALEELIKENEERINLQRRLLSDHDSGINKLSRMIKASTETNLDKTIELVAKYKSMLEELSKQDKDELEEKQRIEEAIKRKKYFANQNIRIKKTKERTNDQKLEAMMIIDELPPEVNFEDKELFDIATKSIELNISNHQELNDRLINIRQSFQQLIKNDKDENIKDLAMLNYQIPVIVLQFSILLSNIKENLEKDKKLYESKLAKEKIASKNSTQKRPEFEYKDPSTFEFRGFPKFEDWWIHELWTSHQAYFALFKWKSIIAGLCKTGEQKRAWSVIFDNWLCIKKMIDAKGELAYEYNFAFDTLILTHAEFEEELVSDNLISMESIIKQITKKENFLTFGPSHNIETLYLQFKREKIKK